VLDDLVKRGLKQPGLAIVDGAPGLEKALGSLWSDLLIQRCTVHKLRNLIAHAPKRLAEEVASDFSDLVYADSAKEVAARRKAFIRKWRLKCRAVADSLEEAGEQLFTFTRLPPSQWKSARTTNAIERLHEEFKRRIKTQTVLPAGETAAMLFWALPASGQIRLRKIDGWRAESSLSRLTSPPDKLPSKSPESVIGKFHQTSDGTAAKYGALSTGNGFVSIRWDEQPNGHSRSCLVFEWQEIGGPPVEAPGNPSYGMTTIRDLIPYEFGGTVDLVLALDGVRCRLELPADWLSNGSEPGSEANAHITCVLRPVKP
jgi:Transposase, Mutator family